MKITRRSLVGGAALAPLAAGRDAMAALPVAPGGPDSGLLELGVRWSILCSQFSHLCRRHATDKEIFPVCDQMKEIERAIAVLPASTTMGMLVKVRIAEFCLRDDPFTEKEITEDTTDLWMCRSVMRDLITHFKFDRG
jgi:hypothetical protein